MCRNSVTRCGKQEYRTTTAQWKAQQAVRGPKVAQLVTYVRNWSRSRIAPTGWQIASRVLLRAVAGDCVLEGSDPAAPEGSAISDRAEPGADLSPSADAALECEVVTCTRTGRALHQPRARHRTRLRDMPSPTSSSVNALRKPLTARFSVTGKRFCPSARTARRSGRSTSTVADPRCCYICSGSTGGARP